MVGERRQAPKPHGAGIEKIGVFLSFRLTTKGFFLHQIILTLPRVAPFRGDSGRRPSAAPPLPLPPHLASPPLEHVARRPARRRGRRRRDLSFPLKAPFWPGFCVDGNFVVLRRRAPGCLDSGLSCADPVPLCSDLSSPGTAAAVPALVAAAWRGAARACCCSTVGSATGAAAQHEGSSPIAGSTSLVSDAEAAPPLFSL